MRDQFLSVIFLVCGLGCLGYAAWDYFGPVDGPGLSVDEPQREIAGCLAGQTKTIAFPFHNRSRHPVKIVGLAPC